MSVICFPSAGGITPKRPYIFFKNWVQWPVTDFGGHRQTLLPVREFNLIAYVWDTAQT